MVPKALAYHVGAEGVGYASIGRGERRNLDAAHEGVEDGSRNDHVRSGDIGERTGQIFRPRGNRKNIQRIAEQVVQKIKSRRTQPEIERPKSKREVEDM